MAIRKDLLSLVVVVFLSLFAVIPLFSQGFFSMHDSQQVARLFELNKALLAGQFPVRWIDGLGFGYGYALFNFYPPLPYYVGEIFHLIGFGFIDSIKIVWFLVIVGSGVSMYFLAKQFFGRVGGVVSAIFYVYAPYHAVDAYVRGALAELSSFVWLPLILLFAFKTAKEGKLKYALLTGFFLSLLMITHNLIFLPFFGFFVLWFGSMVLIFKQNLLKSALWFAVATVFAFGLSAFFWLPSLWEKQFTLVDALLIKNLALYKIHFVCPPQLWDSAWGFGGSAAGCLDGVSFKIGKLHVVASLLSLVVVGKLWLEGNKKLSLVVLSAFLLMCLSIFMTTEYSIFIWDHIKELWYLQFPWRFIEFIVLFSSLLAGSILMLVKNIKWQAVLGAVLIISVIILNAKLFKPQDVYLDFKDSNLTNNEEIKWRVSSTSFEYMPKGVATKMTDLGVLWIDINKDEIQNENFKIKKGTFETTNESFVPGKFSLNVDSKTGGQIQIQKTNFPGWVVWIDGKEVKIGDNNKYKLIDINVPAGKHVIVGQFVNTNIRHFGNLISVAFIIGLIGLLIYGARRNSK